MKLLNTHGSMARTWALHLSHTQIPMALLWGVCLLMMASSAVVHFVFLKPAREDWLVLSQKPRVVSALPGPALWANARLMPTTRRNR